MSKPSKAAEAARTDNVPFEEAMQRLEAIVDAMESGDLPLEALLTRYEEGMKFARVCQAKIAEAELKIQQLEKNAQGALTLQPVALDEREELQA